MSTEQHTDDSVRRALARLGSADPSPWMPHKEKEHPKQIAGTVVRVGLYTTSSAAYGVQTAPEVVLETPEKTWGLRAFHSVLRSQLAQNNVSRATRSRSSTGDARVGERRLVVSRVPGRAGRRRGRRAG